MSPETVSFLDSEPDFVTSRPESEVFGGRCYRHVRHPSPEGLAEVLFTLALAHSVSHLIWFGTKNCFSKHYATVQYKNSAFLALVWQAMYSTCSIDV